MTIMDAIRAEVEAWTEEQKAPPSDEILRQFYCDSFDGGTPEELAEISINAVLSLIGPMPVDAMTMHMATWCSAVLLGVRAARRSGS